MTHFPILGIRIFLKKCAYSTQRHTKKKLPVKITFEPRKEPFPPLWTSEFSLKIQHHRFYPLLNAYHHVKFEKHLISRVKENF